MVSQLHGVCLENAVFEVTGAEVKKDVHKIQEIGEVVQAKPD